MAKAKFEDMKTASKVRFNSLFSCHKNYIKIDLTLGDDEPKVFQFLLSRLKLMLLRLEKAIKECETETLATKLLINERDNFQAAVDYIVQLQS